MDARSQKKFMRLSISLWLSDLRKVISIQWGFHRATFLLRLMRGADQSRKRSWLNYFMSFAEMILQWSEEQQRVVLVSSRRVWEFQLKIWLKLSRNFSLTLRMLSKLKRSRTVLSSLNSSWKIRTLNLKTLFWILSKKQSKSKALGDWSMQLLNFYLNSHERLADSSLMITWFPFLKNFWQIPSKR